MLLSIGQLIFAAASDRVKGEQSSSQTRANEITIFIILISRRNVLNKHIKIDHFIEQ